MSHLLKQKSKIGIVRKERIKYDAYEFGKRERPVVENLAGSQSQPQA